MSLTEAFWLFLAALLAGALNSIVGGGSFVSFPALLATRMPPINANATNTAALWPGLVASAGAYRRVFARSVWRILPALIVASLAGGLLGAIILLHTSQTTFMRLVPWLLLLATLLFAGSEKASVWIRERCIRVTGSTRVATVGGVALQLLIGVYIGYFGAGVSILVMSMLALIGIQDIHEMNGIRTLLVSVANAAAIILFILARAIVWPQTLLMLVGAMLGGYVGAHYAQKLDPPLVRRLVIFAGFAMSLYFFIRH